jgi:hypothetical protein
MDGNNRLQTEEPSQKGNQGERQGDPMRDREQADDRSEGLRRKPDSEPAIPELPDEDVEKVDEGGDATMPPGQGQNPKRNTM